MALSTDLRKLIIEYHLDGKSLREIGQIVRKSFSTIRNIVNKYKRAQRIDDFPKSGRPKKLSVRDVTKICREVRTNPFSSAVKIAEGLSNDSETKVSSSTVRRVLNSHGLHGRVPRKKPFVSPQNKKKRLQFAKLHVSKPQDHWNRTIFTDESKFELFRTKKKQKVWRAANDEMNPKNLLPTVKFGGGSVMVWGCMAASGVGNLVFIENTMKKEDYLKILKTKLRTSVQKLQLRWPWIFQQDNDPKHTAHIVTEWLDKNAPIQLHSHQI